MSDRNAHPGRHGARSRRNFLKWLAAGAAAAVLPGAVRSAPRRKPNFLFFLVDDLGWKDLGCYGSTFHDTPNLDKLAASGMRFTDAYAACPVCSPTRASIVTGKHPARLGITDWIPGQRPKNRKLLAPPIHNQLALKEVTIAEVLKEAGYRTFFAGKWHLGARGSSPSNRGSTSTRAVTIEAHRREATTHRTRIRNSRTAPKAST